jgi:hypothetical protein
MGGSAAMLLIALVRGMPEPFTATMRLAFLAALLTDLFLTLVGEFAIPHASEVAARAAHDISHGHYRTHFWWGSIALGHLLPLALVLLAASSLPAVLTGLLLALAAVASVAGLYLFEYAFVMAPQEIPNS